MGIIEFEKYAQYVSQIVIKTKINKSSYKRLEYFHEDRVIAWTRLKYIFTRIYDGIPFLAQIWLLPTKLTTVVPIRSQINSLEIIDQHLTNEKYVT